MRIPKPSEADRGWFLSLVPDDPRVEVKPMFGNLGAFVNGNMFLGLFGPSVGLRLSPEDGAELLRVEGAGPFGPEERPMGGYVALPAGFRGSGEAARWVERALGHGGALPPKATGKGRPTAAGKR